MTAIPTPEQRSSVVKKLEALVESMKTSNKELIARAEAMTDQLCTVRCKWCGHSMRPQYLRVKVALHWLAKHFLR